MMHPSYEAVISHVDILKLGFLCELYA